MPFIYFECLCPWLNVIDKNLSPTMPENEVWLCQWPKSSNINANRPKNGIKHNKQLLLWFYVQLSSWLSLVKYCSEISHIAIQSRRLIDYPTTFNWFIHYTDSVRVEGYQNLYVQKRSGLTSAIILQAWLVIRFSLADSNRAPKEIAILRQRSCQKCPVI